MSIIRTIYTEDGMVHELDYSPDRNKDDLLHIGDSLVHRLDGPAWAANGSEWYVFKGEIHREDGPAQIMNTGFIGWYLNDMCFEFDDFVHELKLTEEDRVILALKYNLHEND